MESLKPSHAGSPRCVHCGGVIGVYEPIVHMVDGIMPEKTSRAAQPRLSSGKPGPMYHLCCHRLALRARQSVGLLTDPT
jgi:hypothetical protein